MSDPSASANITAPASAAPASAAPAVPPVDDTLGALMICASVGMLLFGLLIHQTFQYFRRFQDDKLFLKLWVAFVFCTETFTIIVGLEELYFYTITNWANPAILLQPPHRIIQVLPSLAVFTPVSVEIFFMRRVWLLGPQYRPFVAISFLLVIAFYANYLTITIVGWTSANPLEWLHRGALYAGIGSVLLEVGDLLTSSILIFVLYRSRSEIRRTNSIIEILIKYTVTTGLICGLSLIISVVFAFIRPNSMIWIASDFVISKLQANVFLATLNARHALSNDFNNVPATVGSKPPLVSFRSGRSMAFRPGDEPTNTIDINVTRYELKSISGADPSAASSGMYSQDAYDGDRKMPV